MRSKPRIMNGATAVKTHTTTACGRLIGATSKKAPEENDAQDEQANGAAEDHLARRGKRHADLSYHPHTDRNRHEHAHRGDRRRGVLEDSRKHVDRKDSDNNGKPSGQ